MASHETSARTLGVLAVIVGAGVLLIALYLGFYIEGTPLAVARSAKGHRIAVPAAVAFVTGTTACLGCRRSWALVAGCIGVAAAVTAVLFTVLIPTPTLS